MPAAMPPCAWPCKIIGFTARPTSSTVVCRTTSTRPVLGSTSTSHTAQPYGYDGTGMTSVHAGERFAGANGGRGGLEQIDGAVGALHGEPATCELDVQLRGLEEGRGDAPALLDDLIRGLRHDDRAEPHRPPGRRPAAPTGIRSVSPVMSFTCPYSTPNHSAMAEGSSSRVPGRRTACRGPRRCGLPAAP